MQIAENVTESPPHQTKNEFMNEMNGGSQGNMDWLISWMSESTVCVCNNARRGSGEIMVVLFYILCTYNEVTWLIR